MPFIQPQLLGQLTGLDSNLRRNGKLFRTIITQNEPKLNKYPLAKGDFLQPFWFNSLQARIWKRISEKTGKRHPDFSKQQFHLIIREFILDLLTSQSMKECEYYDSTKVREFENSFYNNSVYNADQLDWLITFEIYRRLVYNIPF